MKYSNCTAKDLEAALNLINKHIYGGNIAFRRLDNKKFTLRVKSSYGPGHRINTTFLMGMSKIKHLPYACWHVHGDFFDALFMINPKARIRTSRSLITKDGGNWEDFNAGSQLNPIAFSFACDCGVKERYKRGEWKLKSKRKEEFYTRPVVIQTAFNFMV